jgi:hypothetical protein
MDRQAIEARLEELAQLRQQQLEQLKDTQATQQNCHTNLQLLEGARQDCVFWLNQIDMKEKAGKTAELVASNGQPHDFAGCAD